PELSCFLPLDPLTTTLTPMTTMIPPIQPTESTDVCSFHSVPCEDTLETNFLKELIAWPETPLPLNFSLTDTSDPAHRGIWHVGDQLEVLIKTYDFNGRPKKSGGDVLYARLHNRALSAGVVGKVLDHRNGSYTAVFSLLWEGGAQVEVTLVHPSEAITLLEKVTKEQPDRAHFLSEFRSGSITETVTCNVCLKAPREKLCNYTDLHTGEPWFCYRPKKLNCDTRISHFRGGFTTKTEPMEDKRPSIGHQMPIRPSGSKSRGSLSVAGYYYKGVWQALDGRTVHQFNNATAVTQCLKGKVLHLFGDSTVRQWFEYLMSKTPSRYLKMFDLKSPKKAGPYMALDYKNNILVTYRCHGTPILFTPMPASQTRHITSELKGVVGGTNTVIVIAVWAHFTSFPIEVYIRRLLNIRREVVRLLTRAPGTLVIIRTPNPKASILSEIWNSSDWYALQQDKVLRAIFKGLNVRLLDAWEMCLAHHLPHSLHPQPPIINNMMDVVLSHICHPSGNFKDATVQ
uniref:Neurexophilin and PC-esterase domain family member 3 n=1 Tax=Fundulus heteroclitus TaxID=8078 RepID=A0A3Q2Q4J0_FUNHE